MVNQFGVNKSIMVFKIFILRFLNNYPKMKKSLLSLNFLKNNMCRENASEFK